MNYSVGLSFALAVAMGTGCAPHTPPVKVAPAPPPVILTPDRSLSATVLMYNPVGRFVVLHFPSGDLPKRDVVMFVYHGGLKAGEVRITGPVRDFNVVADLTSGAAEAGDVVRDQ